MSDTEIYKTRLADAEDKISTQANSIAALQEILEKNEAVLTQLKNTVVIQAVRLANGGK